MAETTMKAYQNHIGSEINERELFLRMKDHLAQLHTLARGMAHSRKSMHWLAMAGIYEEMSEKTERLMRKGTGLIIPYRN